MKFLVAPKRVVGKDGKVTGIECTRMELGEPDKSGRRRPLKSRGPNLSSNATPSFPPSGRKRIYPSLRRKAAFRSTSGTTWISIK
jgi:NADPH-dependent glutamate synthase beta chain and related oxidoreductases